MKLTNYLEDKLANHVLKSTAYSPPANVFIALHTADSTEAGNIAEVTTAAYPSYVRKQVAFGTVSNGMCGNSADLTWNIDGGGVTFSHVTLWDAATGGNPLFHSELTQPETMSTGNVFRIPASQLSVGFD
jgi:hypothetical protein